MSTDPEPRLERALIIIGPAASGKSTIGQLVAARLSYQIVSFGAYVRAEAAQRALRLDKRDSLERLGAEIAATRGHENFLFDVLGMHADRRRIVIEGVRHAEMLDAIRRAYEATISIYLDVSPELRYVRWLNRQDMASTPEARATFDAIANACVERNVHPLISRVEHVVDGNRDPQDVSAEVLGLLSEFPNWY